jgi:hypothetical protein
LCRLFLMAHADELASSRVLQLAPAIAARRVAAASGHHHPHGHRHGSLQNGSLPPSRKGSGVSRLGSDGASDGFSAPSTPAAALEQVLLLIPQRIHSLQHRRPACLPEVVRQQRLDMCRSPNVTPESLQ